MDQAGYVCSGTCKAFITQEQYNGGLTVCGAVYREGIEHKHS